uniref:BACK domain-containing protein n=1 Tax=Parastrongyloides trichosuri TaxID=131310 RepID=A0A0N4ZDT9_PARTI
MSNTDLLSTGSYLKSEGTDKSTELENINTKEIGKVVYANGLEILWNVAEGSLKIINKSYQEEAKKINNTKNQGHNKDKETTILLAESNQVNISTNLFAHYSYYIQRLKNGNPVDRLIVKASTFDSISVQKIIYYITYGTIEYSLNEVGLISRVATSFEMPSILNDIEVSLVSFGSYTPQLLAKILSIVSHEDYLITIRGKKNVLKVVNEHLTKFLSSNAFLTVSPSAVVNLLSYDKLKVIDEVEAFRIAIYYLVNGNNQLYADPILNCIRYSNITDIEMKAIIHICEAYNDAYIKKCLGYYIEEYLRHETIGKHGENRNMNTLCKRTFGNGSVSVTMKGLEKKSIKLSKSNGF